MNRYRLNQILEVLLFPIIDPELVQKDPLFLCYHSYHIFMEESKHSGVLERERRNKKYREDKQKLIDYLTKHSHGNVKSKDDIQMLCEFFYPMAEIEQEMKYLKRITRDKDEKNGDLSGYYLKSLARISRSLITYRDGVATIRQWVDGKENRNEIDIFNSPTVFNKVEIWNLICRITVPDIYIAVAAVENNLGLSALYAQKSNISLADKLLTKILRKGIAENHLHFNVGFDYDVVWLSYMNLNFIEDEEFSKNDEKNYIRLELAIFRFLVAHYLTDGKLKYSFKNWIRSFVPEDIRKIMEKLYTGGSEKGIDRKIPSILHKMRKYNGGKRVFVRKYDYLLNEVYSEYLEYKTSSEFILLYQSYKYVKENENDLYFAHMFIQYLRLKNEYFSHTFEKHIMKGLLYFQETYNAVKSSASKVLNQEELMTEIFHSQGRIPYLKKLEIRIAPKVNDITLDLFKYNKNRRNILRQLYDQIYHVFYAYRRYILESIIGIKATWKLLNDEKGKTDYRISGSSILEEIKNNKMNVPTLGIVFHFLKSENLEDYSGNYCWRRIFDGNKYYLEHRILKRIRVANIANALEEIRETIPKIHEYIVGIDAASDENAMEPWMFAPAYKIMRSHNYTKPVMEITGGHEKFDRIQNVGFTYHVGEDFRHIISGLRHIDEVLEEYGYKAGDRLGHALALGIDIEQWMGENQVVPIPILEYLENLLWVWGTNTCYGLDLPIQLEVLENQIMDIAKRIYDFSESINVKMLYTAYKKKFEVRHEEIIKQVLEKEKRKKDFVCYCDENIGSCYERWTAEELLTTYYCPVFEEKYGKIELVSVSPEDLALYKKLQEYLIYKVERIGIYIETNPTSNLTIGDFSNMSQHPIFSLNQNGEGGNHVFVTVNSDDPAVFNTNVENELAYIYYTADARGIAKSETLEWIDKIR